MKNVRYSRLFVIKKIPVTEVKSFQISFLLGGIVREGWLFLWRLLVLYCLKAFTGFKQGPNRGIDFQTGGLLGPAE